MAAGLRCPVDLLSASAKKRIKNGEQLYVAKGELELSLPKKRVSFSIKSQDMTLEQIRNLLRAMHPHMPVILIDFEGAVLCSLRADKDFETQFQVIANRFAQSKCNTTLTRTSAPVISL